MTSKEDCPNGLIFTTFAGGMVISQKDTINHMAQGFNKQLIDNLCPSCTFHTTCIYKTQLLDNLTSANERRKIHTKPFNTIDIIQSAME